MFQTIFEYFSQAASSQAIQRNTKAFAVKAEARSDSPSASNLG
jgi:hypothetical protein